MGREKNKTIRLGFSYIALSAIFFFNANVNVIDVLPDVMGYVILLAAMTKLADLSDDIDVIIFTIVSGPDEQFTPTASAPNA